MGFLEWIGSWRRLTDDERFCLAFFHNDEEYETIKQLVRQHRLLFESIKAGFTFFEEDDYMYARTSEPALQPLTDRMNIELKHRFEHEWFHQFKNNAYELLPRLIARNIVGLDDVKKSITLQLFSKDPLHLLLVNDQGLEAHHFFTSIEALTDNRNCCIGMELNDSNVFTMYDQGIVMIDQFEAVKRPVKQLLLPIMDHGIADEGPEARPARVRILAATLPIGGRFSRTYENLKRQIPVDPVLLHRFDLLFINRLSDVAARGAKLVPGFDHLKPADREFIKAYIHHARQIEVKMSDTYEDELIEYLGYLQSKYTRSPKEVTERVLDTLRKLAKASARLELRDVVETRDIQRAKELVESSLAV
ncbi:MAG: hypothetical protein Q7R96_05230 [Nanoarchaeota archaeon]|nr:hypothetical protein [Nanoarchaeota archaeon]